jgi:phenylalanine-4-hydroxylase
MKDGFTHVHEVPPPGAAADWTISQNWDAFTADEHAMWDRLFARQSAMLPGRASEAFLRGIDVLKLEKPGIPDYRELNARLTAATGWQVVAVPGLVPDDVFFDHLASPRAISSAPPNSSTICRNPTSFTTSSAMSRCSPTRCSPIIWSLMARAGCAA